MGSRGDCYDNALCESFFATLERELLERHKFTNREAAQWTIFEFIEGWYNPHRRHSALGYDSPLSYERKQTAWPPIEVTVGKLKMLTFNCPLNWGNPRGVGSFPNVTSRSPLSRAYWSIALGQSMPTIVMGPWP